MEIISHAVCFQHIVHRIGHGNTFISLSGGYPGQKDLRFYLLVCSQGSFCLVPVGDYCRTVRAADGGSILCVQLRPCVLRWCWLGASTRVSIDFGSRLL